MAKIDHLHCSHKTRKLTWLIIKIWICHLFFSKHYFFIISVRLWDSDNVLNVGPVCSDFSAAVDIVILLSKWKSQGNVIILYTCCAIMMLMSPATYVILFMEILLFETWCYCKLTLGTKCCIVCIWMYVQLM